MATGYNAFKGLDKPKAKYMTVAERKESSERTFITLLINVFLTDQPINKRSMEKMAANLEIIDARQVKELAEYAMVQIGRGVAANKNKSITEKYEKLVSNYLKQVNLTLRTSTSILLQQYSTPIPIAYLMGIYCRIDQRTLDGKNKFFFEPSAGNGILTVAGTPQDFVVNEIDELRRSNLEREPYYSVFGIDGSQDFTLSNHSSFFDNVKFDAVITNPPFAALDKQDYKTFSGYEIRDLDHLMAIRALSVMSNNGRAAIIVGGHTKWDERGVVQSGKNLKFLSYLYKHYFVDDVILVNGDLNSKMGTSFDIRIILINGRKPKPEGYAPKKQETNHTVVNTFKELYECFAEVSGRDDMEVEKQNPIDAKYKYKVETDTKGTLYFEELPSDVYWGDGIQDPEDKNKAFWYGYDNGTSLIPFQTVDGKAVYKYDSQKTPSAAAAQAQRIRILKLKYKYQQ